MFLGIKRGGIKKHSLLPSFDHKHTEGKTSSSVKIDREVIKREVQISFSIFIFLLHFPEIIFHEKPEFIKFIVPVNP